MTLPGPIHCVGIANRGEAAMRCVRAVKSLRAREGSSLRTVALYVDVDRDAPFVRHADAAVRLPATPGDEVRAYLDHDVLLDALRRGQADAVWPGWGFVAEDATFADRVVAAGMHFLGPSGAAMRALGDKVRAKQVAERVGVPVTPWSGGVVEDDETAARCAERLGYPLLVKAAGGGGGRGIRIVEEAAALPAALRAAAAEARAAFGDARLFLERRILGGRHVEVQIAADHHGHVVALGTRDCSVQRRHQKLIEEAPPPGLAPALLAELAAAAVRLAREVGYVGLGTVEFLVTGAEARFLEMNPRLQVEHAVTEVVTGLDLVQLQIRIARGERLAGTTVCERGVAIEARICAEDPDTGFLPAPGRVARFDPALGPGIRVDAGIAAGSVVPAVFDSLIVKLIACGESREEARSRLVCALRDLDLVIEGGASNAGYLVDLLESGEFRAGGVDTGWVDRGGVGGVAVDDAASDALVAAAVLAYQRRRRDARLNFYADVINVSPSCVPPPVGQEVDLSFGHTAYRLTVLALGSWRYRIHLDGRMVPVVLREAEAPLARLEIAGRTRRIAYDATDAGLRLDLDGRSYRFGWETTGQVRAPTPAMVVAVTVARHDRVAPGQLLGLLEVMKMEIGISAPVAGVVSEVRVSKGQRVAAGDVLVVIDSTEEGRARGGAPAPRLILPAPADPLRAILGPPDLSALDGSGPTEQRAAITALGQEVRAVLLGYDADPERVRALVALLESADRGGFSTALRDELAVLGGEVVVFADLEQLFVTAPEVSTGGQVGPSNAACLRAWVRRMRAGGAGVGPDFAPLLRAALRHYGVASLAHGDALERAVLRMFATQNTPTLRRLLARVVLCCLTALARAGAPLAGDTSLGQALERIAAMRSLVSDALADAAIAAHAAIFETPRLERRAERAAERVAPWLAAAGAEAPAPPPEALLDLAAVARRVFDRAAGWLAESDVGRRGIALSAYLLRLYSPAAVIGPTMVAWRSGRIHRLELPGRRAVVGVTAGAAEIARTAAELCAAIAPGDVEAIELVVPPEDGLDPDAVTAAVAATLPAALPAERCTLSFVRPGGGDVHRTLVRAPAGVAEDTSLLGLHPETAARIGFARLRDFDLERMPGAEDLYCFLGRSRAAAEDERFFVLGEVRGWDSGDPEDAALHLAAFECVFHRATSALRELRGAHDPRRRLHWNRIAIAIGPTIALDPPAIETLARRLAPATRHLGLEKVVVRLRLHHPAAPAAAGEPVDVVVGDLTGSRMEIALRPPQTAPLEPASDYERKVVEARRRRLVYPYEIVRMLTGGNGAARFEEYDLDPESEQPRAVCVSARPHGCNRAGIVFGILATPTEKVPEGLRRVLVLSDPTRDMGALAAPECDRLIAAFDLAEQHGLGVEWIPISAGARIAMDSGTENLDATARVARRIITFTEAGGVVHVIVYGVNVGAQSYWNALATMVGRTRGALIMTPEGSMVLTGRAALEASGSVAAESEIALGGFERVMGPNGEAQYYARDLATALRTLEEHYRYTHVVPGEAGPRRHRTTDPFDRDVTRFPYPTADGAEPATVGALFDDAGNPGRRRPFAMRAVMQALIDQDGGHAERWAAWAGAQTAIVWDTHLGGVPVCLIGIESQNVARDGYRPLDGPESWTGGTLFPLSSKKVARALDATSGNRPAVILANLSGFDGSPESLRQLQLEHGAEIARAVVGFRGPLLFLVVSRYHGGAYVVFSRALNPHLRALALEGSYASVIGGSAAAAVVLTREVRARAAADPAVRAARQALRDAPTPAARDAYEQVLAAATSAAQAHVAAEFDAVHTVERACRVRSLDAVVDPRRMRPVLIEALHDALAPRPPVTRT
ncbi:MAG: biotin carboxylase N-terminal domain-containing protein [Candidatus Binatia bacterium]